MAPCGHHAQQRLVAARPVSVAVVGAGCACHSLAGRGGTAVWVGDGGGEVRITPAPALLLVSGLLVCSTPRPAQSLPQDPPRRRWRQRAPAAASLLPGPRRRRRRRVVQAAINALPEVEVVYADLSGTAANRKGKGEGEDDVGVPLRCLPLRVRRRRPPPPAPSLRSRTEPPGQQTGV
ncbi:unnamed protein product [Urochloa humidicola]